MKKKTVLLTGLGLTSLAALFCAVKHKDALKNKATEIKDDVKEIIGGCEDFIIEGIPTSGKKEFDDIEYVLSDTPSEKKKKEEPALEERLYSTDLAEKLKIATSTARRRLASTKAVKLVYFDTNTNRPYILKSDFKKFKKLFEVKK